MAQPLEPRVRELIHARNYAHVGTTGSDGVAQVTAVWVLDEGDHVVIYKEKGSVALRNLSRNPHASISVIDFDDPYLGCTLRGRVAELDDGPTGLRWLRDRAVEYTGADFPADEMPTAGALIKFEIERQSWHHFDSMTHRSG